MSTKSFLSEFFATALLVFIGTGSVLFVQNESIASPQLWISIAFGCVVAFGILIFGKLSGAHMNPAVTIALWLDSSFEGNKVLSYLFAQFTGGIFGSYLLSRIYPQTQHYGDTLPVAGVWQSFLLEFGLTFLLMAGVLRVVHRNRTVVFSALLIGTIVGFEAYFAGPYCGASMNPARSIAPAVFSGLWSDIWIYLSAPVLGAISALVFTRLQKPSDSQIIRLRRRKNG